MNCRHFHQRYVELLDVDDETSEVKDLLDHLESCPQCAQFYKKIRQTFAALHPAETVEASPHFKERVMSRIVNVEQRGYPANVTRGSVRWRLGKPAALAASIALLLGVGLLVKWILPSKGPAPTGSAYYLFTRACAAEEALFSKGGVVHIINEIIVRAASDPTLAGMRWIPIVDFQESGRLRIHQLTLPAEPGEQYVVQDEAWFDSSTGRFVRLFTVGDKPIFANSYDGQAIHSLQVDSDGTVQVTDHPVTGDFHPPTTPAQFLGIAAGLRHQIDKGDESRFQDEGDGTLEDGSAVRILKVGTAPDPSDGQTNTYWLFRIRQDDNTIAEKEWFVGGESLLVVRRVSTGTVGGLNVPWDLAGFRKPADETQDRPQVSVSKDLVIGNVSVQHMVDKADFETYIFATDPSWAGQRQITDILDIVSPPHRMFAITYRAKDGRHVVLIQSPSYNKMLKVTTALPGAKLVHESPAGFKLWSGPPERMTWLAGILLQSARHAIKDPPSKDRTGYLIETPAGTFPALAINGQVTDEELRSLIDSLVPTSEYQGE